MSRGKRYVMKIVLATNNPGKVRELQQMLAGRDLDVRAQREFGVPDIEEAGLSFVENALLKARNACAHTGLPAIGDDSGLVVQALEGAPGIYSARYAGTGASDRENLDKLLTELAKVPAPRRAHFHCCAVYLRRTDDPVPLICQAQWHGEIIDSPRGDNGFGYDPVFFLPERDCTAAQLPAEEKNRLSHRGQALARLLEKLAARNVESDRR